MKYGIAGLMIVFVCFMDVAASPLKIVFEPTFYSYNNADLTDYKQSTYNQNKATQSRNTDDRATFTLSTVTLDYAKKYLNSELFMTIRADGYWGNDTLGKNSQSSLMFDRLYARTAFGYDSWVAVGRQRYGIGEAVNEYFFNSIIDGAVMNLSVDIYGIPLKFDLMGDVTGLSSTPANTNRFSTIKKDDEQTDDFKGNTVSVRGGGKVGYYCAKMFGYYVRYSASHDGGSDISDDGRTTVNKVDGDYLYIYGGRLFNDFHVFGKADFTLVFSDGYDFQQDRDVRYNGRSFAFNYEFNLNSTKFQPWKYLNNIRFNFSIGQFGENYCGMDSDGLGGLLLDDYYGYKMSAIAGPYHFIDYDKDEANPTYVDRSVSKNFIKTGIMLSVWYVDMDYSFLLLKDCTKKEMGKLHALSLNYVDDNLKVFLRGEYFKPGQYYKKTGANNSFVPAGSDPFYCVSLGARYEFTLLD